MSIPVIHAPVVGLLARPTTEPLWDTEWLPAGVDGPLDFFRHCRGEAFHFPEAARAAMGSSRSWKRPSDTNVHRKDGCPLLSHNRYNLRGVVLYPCTEGVADMREYRGAVEILRQSATLMVRFGTSVHGEWPLRDTMANVAFNDMDTPDGGQFDPSEAPDLSHRRGIDLEIQLASPEDMSRGSRGRERYPMCILQKDEFFVRIYPGEPLPRPVGIRCYLVGTHLRTIQG